MTSKDAKTWYRRLRPKLSDGDRLLIVELNFDERAGWLPHDVWAWINDKHVGKATSAHAA